MIENKEDEEDENELEQAHFTDIVVCFKSYHLSTLKMIANWEASFSKTPQKMKDILGEKYHSFIERLKFCAAENQKFLDFIVEPHLECVDKSTILSKEASAWNIDKLRSTITQFVREWSAEGRDERSISHNLFFSTLKEFLPQRNEKVKLKILIPGAGLGRLCYDLAFAGYEVEGNEFTFFMLFGSNCVLNKITCDRTIVEKKIAIYPFIHNMCNKLSLDDMVKPILIPDVVYQAPPPDLAMSMVEGEFVSVYSEQKEEIFDCVITEFFIDTAHCVYDYITTIKHILRKGGIWMNFGPLLFHYADMSDEFSVEMSYEEIKTLILASGFVFLKETLSIPTTYCSNPASLLTSTYKCIFFVVRKKEEKEKVTT